MKKVLFLLLISLFSSTAQATYEFDREPITECWSEGGIIDFASFDASDEPAFFTPEQCNNAESDGIQRNFFAAYGAAEMEKINEVMQEKMQLLWDDNGGHSHALIQESFGLIRTYNTCLASLCDLIARDCSTRNQVGDWEKNFARCDNRREELTSINQAQLEITLQGNVAGKKRSLMVEKMSSLSLRFDQFLHNRLSAFNSYIDIADNAIRSLSPQTW